MNARMIRIAALAFVVGAAGLALLTGCRRADPGAFDTPEEAVAAANAVAGTGDDKRVEEIFGPGSLELFRSGDAQEDAADVARVKSLMAEKVSFEDLDADTKVALFGEQAWPFPIPLVRREGKWRFDTAAGREELLNRRIGEAELATLASLHAYVDAQREYAAAGRDGNAPAFAQRFMSTEGKHDGLYWPVAEGEELSPLGDLLADAAARTEPKPYHGYYYRILKGQGKSAAGGEHSYVDDKGLMTRGFAAIAWPAKHGNSGVMTFLINQRGIAYQKDLGPETEAVATAIEAFDPDATWLVTGDSLTDVVEDGEDEEEPAAAAPQGGS